MSERLTPLDRRLLELLRAASPAPPDARARVRARLEMAIPALSAGRPGGPGSRGGGGGFSFGSGLLAVAAFVAGGAAGAGLYARLAPRPHAEIVYVERPVREIDVAAARGAAGDAPPAVAATPAVPATAAPSARPAAFPSGARPSDPIYPATARPSQLSAERNLLDEARAALVQGEPGRALERLERHRRRFATPLLLEERDAMEVEALVLAGRGDEARQRADAFRRHCPESLFASTVEAAVAGAP